jgi:hypothetical protein
MKIKFLFLSCLVALFNCFGCAQNLAIPVANVPTASVKASQIIYVTELVGGKQVWRKFTVESFKDYLAVGNTGIDTSLFLRKGDTAIFARDADVQAVLNILPQYLTRGQYLVDTPFFARKSALILLQNSLNLYLSKAQYVGDTVAFARDSDLSAYLSKAQYVGDTVAFARDADLAAYLSKAQYVGDTVAFARDADLAAYLSKAQYVGDTVAFARDADLAAYLSKAQYVGDTVAFARDADLAAYLSKAEYVGDTVAFARDVDLLNFSKKDSVLVLGGQTNFSGTFSKWGLKTTTMNSQTSSIVSHRLAIGLNLDSLPTFAISFPLSPNYTVIDINGGSVAARHAGRLQTGETFKTDIYLGVVANNNTVNMSSFDYQQADPAGINARLNTTFNFVKPLRLSNRNYGHGVGFLINSQASNVTGIQNIIRPYQRIAFTRDKQWNITDTANVASLFLEFDSINTIGRAVLQRYNDDLGNIGSGRRALAFQEDVPIVQSIQVPQAILMSKKNTLWYRPYDNQTWAVDENGETTVNGSPYVVNNLLTTLKNPDEWRIAVDIGGVLYLESKGANQLNLALFDAKIKTFMVDSLSTYYAANPTKDVRLMIEQCLKSIAKYYDSGYTEITEFTPSVFQSVIVAWESQYPTLFQLGGEFYGVAGRKMVANVLRVQAESMMVHRVKSGVIEAFSSFGVAKIQLYFNDIINDYS